MSTVEVGWMGVAASSLLTSAVSTIGTTGLGFSVLSVLNLFVGLVSPLSLAGLVTGYPFFLAG